MNWVINSGIVIGTFIIMEAWAWIMHKYLLHGPLWFLHKSHHRYNPGWFEWNDLVSVLYGLISAGLVMYGMETGSALMWVGVGIAVYGVFYFLLHDIIIHRRIKVRYQFKNPYVNRLIRAHKMHHKHAQKEDSEAFGFLYATERYRVDYVRNKKPASEEQTA